MVKLMQMEIVNGTSIGSDNPISSYGSRLA
jgi:hypothetical protein